jgi:hypothetical protein
MWMRKFVRNPQRPLVRRADPAQAGAPVGRDHRGHVLKHGGLRGVRGGGRQGVPFGRGDAAQQQVGRQVDPHPGVLLYALVSDLDDAGGRRRGGGRLHGRADPDVAVDDLAVFFAWSSATTTPMLKPVSSSVSAPASAYRQ